MRTLRKFLILAVSLGLVACTTTGLQSAQELRGVPVVVAHGLARGAAPKSGITAVSDTGGVLFSPMALEGPGENIDGYTGGVSGSFPRWVRVTWRIGDDIDFDRINDGWQGGKIVGDYTIQVLERIPREVIEYARARRGRAIVLRFHLKDDGVLFAWDVQETSKNGQAWVYTMHGGDF